MNEQTISDFRAPSVPDIFAPEGEIDNYDITGLQNACDNHERIELHSKMQSEFERLRPVIIQSLVDDGQCFEDVQMGLNMIVANCFEGIPRIEILSRMLNRQQRKWDSDYVGAWKKKAVDTIMDLAEKGKIQISVELLKFIRNQRHEILYVHHVKRINKGSDIAAHIQESKDKVRKTFLSAVVNATPPIEYTEDDIEEITRKVGAAEINGGLDKFSYIVVRNWVLDKVKSVESSQRKAVKELHRLKEEQLRVVNDKEYQRKFLAAKKEMIDIMGQIGSNPESRNSVIRNIGILYFSIFQKEPDDQLEKRYPDTNEPQRRQWKKRGRDFIWAMASENLQSFLGRNSKKRKSNTSDTVATASA